MKLTALSFLVLLFCAHGASDAESPLEQPLSLFRDGEQGLLGHALFALLLLMSVFQLQVLYRARREGDLCVLSLAAFLLVFVAFTPSKNSFHILCSFVLLGLLYGFYALLLAHARSLWLVPHTVIPFVWMLATSCHSFGLWQKGLIVYFVLAASLHHHLLSRGRSRDVGRTDRPTAARGLPLRRRKVFVVEAGKSWTRRKLNRIPV
jgi:hypothetical protein